MVEFIRQFNELNGEEKASLIFIVLTALSPLIYLIIAWFRTHPIVDQTEFNDNVDEMTDLRGRYKTDERLVQDLELFSKRTHYENVTKIFHLEWQSNTDGQIWTSPLWTDDRKIRKYMRKMAKRNLELTRKNMLKVSWRLPKKHGRSHETTYFKNTP